MTKIASAEYVAAAKKLLQQAQLKDIPYVNNGMTTDGMDCQGLCEYLLIECGVPKSECNLAGSNAHYRNCVWKNTPEACIEEFGCIPDGAWLFIVSADGVPAKYQGDDYGNASHMGVRICKGTAIHASASRGKVAESVFNDKTVRNGGWNMVGLPPWIDYGLDIPEEVEDTEEDTEEEQLSMDISAAETKTEVVQTVPKTLEVWSANGNPVKMRMKPDRGCGTYEVLPVGTKVKMQKTRRVKNVDWVQIKDGNRTGWMMKEFLIDASKG